MGPPCRRILIRLRVTGERELAGVMSRLLARGVRRPYKRGMHHRDSRRFLRTLALLGLACGLATTAWAQPERPAPSHTWPARMSRVYAFEEQSGRRAADARPATRRGWLTVTCLESKPDGARVLIDAADADAAVAVLVSAQTTGRVTLEPEMLPLFPEVADLLTIIPEFGQTVRTEAAWTTAPDPLGRVWRFTPVDVPAASAAMLVFDGERRDPTGVEEVAGAAARLRCWFDTAAGAVLRLELVTEDPTADRRSVWRIQLARTAPLADADVLRLESELTRWQQTLVATRTLADALLAAAPPDLDDPSRPAHSDVDARVREQVDRLRRTWEALRHDCRRGTPVWRLAESALRHLPAQVTRLRGRAGLSAAWLDRLAPAWSLQDAAGQTVRSETVRDRPTLELLWDTGSRESLRMLAAVGDLASTTPADRLHVIGLNVDADLARGRAAAERVAPKLRNVFAGPALAADVPELPVARLVGPDGRIQAVWAGWTPNLAQAVAARLPKEAADTSGAR